MVELYPETRRSDQHDSHDTLHLFVLDGSGENRLVTQTEKLGDNL